MVFAKFYLKWYVLSTNVLKCNFVDGGMKELYLGTLALDLPRLIRGSADVDLKVTNVNTIRHPWI